MRRVLVPLALFSLAFAYEEASIVLYLRRIAFPPGPSNVFYLECGREASTLVILLVVAWLCGRTGTMRLRAFLLAFGLWDVGYYTWLYVLSGSPTLTSTDVLFLLPVPWLAPVWSALAFALVLVAVGLFGLRRRRGGLFVAGLALGFLSFIAQGVHIVNAYPVWLFIPGVILSVLAIKPGVRAVRRTVDAAQTAG
jgi:hypothetical protein